MVRILEHAYETASRALVLKSQAIHSKYNNAEHNADQIKTLLNILELQKHCLKILRLVQVSHPPAS
jgi:hypothetical protein